LIDREATRSSIMSTDSEWNDWESTGANGDGDSSADRERSSAGDEGIVIRLGKEAVATGESFESAPTPYVRARILWPALGFPAVIAPRAQAVGTAMQNGDATRCVTVLLLSDRKFLSKREAATHLRCVPWAERARRHIAEERFPEEELEIRNDAQRQFAWPDSSDSLAELLVFGGDAEGARSVSVTLANRVRTFYRDQGLPYLHEIRISEQASNRLADGLYQLFWNNRQAGDAAPSEELQLLLQQFAPKRRSTLGDFWTRNRARLLEEYEYEYRPFHPITGTPVKGARTEVLHPLFVNRRLSATIRVGHLTDTHVSSRADMYGHNLRKKVIKADYNNFNVSTSNVYAGAAADSDIVLWTGDLIDYGRGHWARGSGDDLHKDELYHTDRNWFLFHDLMASGDTYRVPVYTILGNHDWRINPYPPFTKVGAPGPRLHIHDHARFTVEEQKRILEAAHGPGADLMFSYEKKAENRFLDALKSVGTVLKALGNLLIQTKTMDVEGFPAETTVESVAWYLLVINPFFDYDFQLPGRHQVLMLDWAKDEDVLFPIIAKGKEWPYMLWQLDTAADPGPKAKRCLTSIQQRMVRQFLDSPSKAKIIGVHAPPIGPYPDWMDPDMFRGRKTYERPADARGPTNFATKRPDGTIEEWKGHPIFAIRPRSGDAGMEADYGSFVQGREWFIKEVSNPKSGVRAVFSGHIHRNGLFVVHVPPASAGPILAGEMLVRQIAPPAVHSARPPAVSLTSEGTRGPLYVNTTSGGPRGNNYSRVPTEAERRTGGLSTDPGFARVDLAADGTIERAEFRFAQPTPRAWTVAEVTTAAPARLESVFDQAMYENLFEGASPAAGQNQFAETVAETSDEDLERRIAAIIGGHENGGDEPATPEEQWLNSASTG
jgi:hypothetical protein